VVRCSRPARCGPTRLPRHRQRPGGGDRPGARRLWRLAATLALLEAGCVLFALWAPLGHPRPEQPAALPWACRALAGLWLASRADALRTSVTHGRCTRRTRALAPGRLSTSAPTRAAAGAGPRHRRPGCAGMGGRPRPLPTAPPPGEGPAPTDTPQRLTPRSKT
jgi:hypothetical protein